MTPNFKTINEAFKEYFEMVPATTDTLRSEVYRLRYQVYCGEMHVLDPENYQEGMEVDEFDSHSAHYLIRHRKSGEFAATTRLILPNPENPNKLFLVEEHNKIDKPHLLKLIDRRHFAEVSRFCVSKEFKKRKNETHTLAAVAPNFNEYEFTVSERRAFPHIAFALFACLVRASHENNIHYWCASMEASFLRFISIFGVYPAKIGPASDYHGERWPCIIDVDAMLDNVAEKNRQVWETFTDEGRYWRTQKRDDGATHQKSTEASK